jgi:hypothetical protein
MTVVRSHCIDEKSSNTPYPLDQYWWQPAPGAWTRDAGHLHPLRSAQQRGPPVALYSGQGLSVRLRG